MSPKTFFDFPREVRDLIYIYALSSITGYIFALQKYPENSRQQIHLVPYLLPDALYSDSIPLRLLQTCRAIYSEAKDIVYEQNTWVFDVDQLPAEFEKRPWFSYRIRHIWLKVNMCSRRNLRDTAEVLKILRAWAERAGTLRTVTLNVAADSKEMEDLLIVKDFGEPIEFIPVEVNPHAGQMLFDEYLEVFRDNCGDGQWPGVQRKLDLRVDRIEYDPREAVIAMHTAFGGELWVDDRLCYKDGREVLKPFAFARGMWQLC